ncbi:MAG TPA: hypothetical protein VKR53_15550 [Puia sp.]|nr:hypothetical protein [Puia sp.]
MEVHHHPDVHRKRKKFKEYFLEFLMIFLAVTLGFFAENIREYVSDKTKVKEYMKEITSNLKFDIIRCNKNQNVSGIAGLDSFRAELKIAIHGKLETNLLYYFNFLYGSRHNHAAFNTSAIAELKNSGYLRLVKNKKIVYDLSDYYERKIVAANTNLPDNSNVLKSESEIFSLLNLDQYVTSYDNIDATTSHPNFDFSKMLKSDPPFPLMDTDKKQLEKLYNDESQFEINIKRYNFWLMVCKNAASQLIADINKEYNFQDD